MRQNLPKGQVTRRGYCLGAQLTNWSLDLPRPQPESLLLWCALGQSFRAPWRALRQSFRAQGHSSVCFQSCPVLGQYCLIFPQLGTRSCCQPLSTHATKRHNSRQMVSKYSPPASVSQHSVSGCTHTRELLALGRAPFAGVAQRCTCGVSQDTSLLTKLAHYLLYLRKSPEA